MAEAAVTFFLSKLSELIAQESILLHGIDEQIATLRRELEWIRSFLRDADAKRKENERIKVWVSHMRDVAYDAEDVIDKFALKVERQRWRSSGIMSSMNSCVSCDTQLTTIHEVGKQIEEINRRIEKISVNKSKYGIESLPNGESSTSSSRGRAPSRKEKMVPVVEELDVVGFKDDAEELVSRLTEGQKRREVISIVGMGGLGKTTLAKKVYNSRDVRKYFNCRAWVFVSQEYRLRELLHGIIKCTMVLKKEEIEMVEKMNAEELRMKLYHHLEEKRYLVVVDDIWNTEVWDGLKSAFPDRLTGSRILLTTRNKAVALYADGRSPPYQLRFLREDECWELFLKKVFMWKMGASHYPYLMKLGREIVAKCGGLPLAVVVLGGLLSSKEKSSNVWEKVLRSVNWQLSEGQLQISRILDLSYNDLPYQLKSCFLYLGLFPEDAKISAKKLIRLWVAEGFIQQRGEEAAEDVGEAYLEELIHRNLIQVAKKSSSGQVKECRVHDLLRDLSSAEAREDRFLDVHGNASSSTPTMARRLAIHYGISKYISQNRNTLRLRSLFCFNQGENLESKRYKFYGDSFKFLRVLDINGAYIWEIPREITDELLHLRYLGFSETHIDRLSNDIYKLNNLQTLHLTSDRPILLPRTIGKMRQLRHICVGELSRMNPHQQFDCLSNLQTLSMITAGKWIRVGLEKLTNLKKLGIQGDLSPHEEALSNSIVKLGGLRSLRLRGGHRDTIPALRPVSQHNYLLKLHLSGRLSTMPSWRDFPPNLMKLTLEIHRLEQDPFITLQRLPNLRILVLSLYSYCGREMVCSTGGFPQLQLLVLKVLEPLSGWRAEGGALPRLTTLVIPDQGLLEMLPQGLHRVTTVREQHTLYS